MPSQWRPNSDTRKICSSVISMGLFVLREDFLELRHILFVFLAIAEILWRYRNATI